MNGLLGTIKVPRGQHISQISSRLPKANYDKPSSLIRGSNQEEETKLVRNASEPSRIGNSDRRPLPSIANAIALRGGRQDLNSARARELPSRGLAAIAEKDEIRSADPARESNYKVKNAANYHYRMKNEAKGYRNYSYDGHI